MSLVATGQWAEIGTTPPKLAFLYISYSILQYIIYYKDYEVVAQDKEWENLSVSEYHLDPSEQLFCWLVLTLTQD